jgi:hypothetical protein
MAVVVVVVIKLLLHYLAEAMAVQVVALLLLAQEQASAAQEFQVKETMAVATADFLIHHIQVLAVVELVLMVAQLRARLYVAQAALAHRLIHLGVLQLQQVKM